MNPMAALFALVFLAIVVLILAGVMSDRIMAVVRHRAPNFWFEGEGLILWGLVVLAAFAMGMVVMYLILRL